MNTAIKVWTKEEIAEKIETDMKWLIRGVLAIYARQTADEKIQDTVKYHNGQGFRPQDAKFMSSIAKWIKKNRPLTEKQTYATRKRMTIYVGQLTKIANKKL